MARRVFVPVDLIMEKPEERLRNVLQVRLPDSLLSTLKSEAMRQDKCLSSLVRTFIENEIRKGDAA